MRYQIKFTCIFWAVCLCGCANIRITDPPRTATEQFLLSHAASQSIDDLSFDALFGRKVFIDDAHFAPAEREFVLAEFRAGLFRAGAEISLDLNNAEIVVEVRSRGVGIDRYGSLLGIPSLTAPSGVASGAEGAAASAIITPELAITKNIKQIAFANVSYVAYWKDSGEIVATEGPSTGRAWREDWWFLGMGPKSVGDIITIEKEVK